jgi:uncharacterized protein with PIN domain
MTCKCGYSFVKSTLNALEKDKEEPHDSYAVINDKQYKKFSKAERMIWEHRKDKDKKLNVIAKAAQYVGNMMFCPECNRLVITLPENEETLYFIPED